MTHNLDKKCILMVFIEFQNIEIFCNISRFLAKNRHFFADAAKISEKGFQRKIELVLGKWFHWSINW